jgi:hypothetical protein
MGESEQVRTRCMSTLCTMHVSCIMFPTVPSTAEEESHMHPHAARIPGANVRTNIDAWGISHWDVALGLLG